MWKYRVFSFKQLFFLVGGPTRWACLIWYRSTANVDVGFRKLLRLRPKVRHAIQPSFLMFILGGLAKVSVSLFRTVYLKCSGYCILHLSSSTVGCRLLAPVVGRTHAWQPTFSVVEKHPSWLCRWRSLSSVAYLI